MRQRINGWLVLDKPAGLTSASAVNRLRRYFQTEKAGHSGTLDPDATGVLAIAFGEATKTIPALDNVPKTYEFTVRWGAETSTDDAAGEVIGTSGQRPSEEAIRVALPGLTGDIFQVPPRVSAVKVAGRRAYDLARDGIAAELAPRALHVADLRLTEVSSADEARFAMTCGRGGYVRGIARDLGRALGCLGHVGMLRRLSTGPFTLDQAVTLDAPAARPLLPVALGLAAWPEIACTPDQARDLRLGRRIAISDPKVNDGAAWISCMGEPVATGLVSSGLFAPKRVFAGN